MPTLICPLCVTVSNRCGCGRRKDGLPTGLVVDLIDEASEVPQAKQLRANLRCVECGSEGQGLVVENTMRALTNMGPTADGEGDVFMCNRHGHYRVGVQRVLENRCPKCNHTWAIKAGGGQQAETRF